MGKREEMGMDVAKGKSESFVRLNNEFYDKLAVRHADNE